LGVLFMYTFPPPHEKQFCVRSVSSWIWIAGRRCDEWVSWSVSLALLLRLPFFLFLTCECSLLYWIKSPLEGSYWIWMRHVTSRCLVLPHETWIHHVVLNQVTSNCVMLPCFTLSSVTYTYTCIENPLPVSHISTVLASVVSNTLAPTLHLKFCRIFFCQLVDSNGYPPPIFGVLSVHPVALHS